MEWTDGEYRISDDKTLLSVDKICEFLSKSYWADQRPRETIQRSINNSICYGIYHQGKQIGFARAVSDLATMYWLCDVFIAEEFRGKGLGKKLVQCIIESDELKGLPGMLRTKDAHGLYEQYGFENAPDRFMRRDPLKQTAQNG